MLTSGFDAIFTFLLLTATHLWSPHRKFACKTIVHPLPVEKVPPVDKVGPNFGRCPLVAISNPGERRGTYLHVITCTLGISGKWDTYMYYYWNWKK